MANIAPIRTLAEINTIINNAQIALASLGSDIMFEEMQGIDESNTLHKDKIYRLILLNAYLFTVLDQYGNILKYFLSPINTVQFNNILTGMQQLANMSGPSIPLLLARNGAVQYYPVQQSSTSGGQQFMVYMGGYDASTNLFPAAPIGSGSGGAINQGNMWSVIIGGSPGGEGLSVGAMIMAKINNPGQTLSNWFIWF